MPQIPTVKGRKALLKGSWGVLARSPKLKMPLNPKPLNPSPQTLNPITTSPQTQTVRGPKP